MRGTIVNRITKHYLRQWAYFDKNFDSLTNGEEVKMKTLYAALKELDPNERKFLAEKYRVKVRGIVTDAELAEKHGITLNEYRKKRLAVETKLQTIFDIKVPMYQAELRKALDIDFGRAKSSVSLKQKQAKEQREFEKQLREAIKLGRFHHSALRTKKIKK